MIYKYFRAEEVEGLDPELVSKLDTARQISGVPFRITSGRRTCEANKLAMGVESSSHILGKAVDLACDESVTRFAILASLIKVGFVRIGVYDKHIHCDVDSTKVQKSLWTGISH